MKRQKVSALDQTGSGNGWACWELGTWCGCGNNSAGTTRCPEHRKRERERERARERGWWWRRALLTSISLRTISTMLPMTTMASNTFQASPKYPYAKSGAGEGKDVSVSIQQRSSISTLKCIMCLSFILSYCMVELKSAHIWGAICGWTWPMSEVNSLIVTARHTTPRHATPHQGKGLTSSLSFFATQNWWPRGSQVEWDGLKQIYEFP